MNKYEELINDNELKEVVNNIENRGINVILVNTRTEALEKIKELIPKNSEISNGGSTTLSEIGFLDYLKANEHGWINLNEEVLKEKDSKKQTDLRRKSVTSEYFLGSINAIAKTGELVACDATGSRVTAYPFAAKNLILVSGINKITSSLEDAIKRVREYVYPLENERAKKAYGFGSTIGKWVIIEREIFKGRTTLILVKEKLGF
ncbi:MAG: lactate utilization protein [Nanoarchaeota archaeon]